MESAHRPGVGRRGRHVASRGAVPRFELHCAGCGYGVVVLIAPERCPMCNGTVWQHAKRHTARV